MRSFPVAVICTTALLFTAGLPAQEADTNPCVFRLRPQEDETYLNLSISLEGTDFIFKKEPQYEGRRIVRGAVAADREQRPPAAKNALGYAWDLSGQKLYLDLNQNLDLTDDPEGVFPSEGRYLAYQIVEGIRFTSGEGSSQVSYLFNMDLRNDYCRVMVRSGWRGTIELDGETWRLEILDNLDGEFGKGDYFSFGHPSDASLRHLHNRFPAEGRLFLDGVLYTFDCTPKDGALEVAISRSTPALGDLIVEGKLIGYVILDGPQRVILSKPAQREKIPLGAYEVQTVTLDGEETGLHSWQPGVKVNVAANAPATLKAGGPLRNTITVERFANTLEMSYKLAGIGGEEYYDSQPFNKDQPRFVVCKGDKEVVSGTFRYG